MRARRVGKIPIRSFTFKQQTGCANLAECRVCPKGGHGCVDMISDVSEGDSEGDSEGATANFT